MSSISIETKKMTDLGVAASISGSDLVIIHNSNGMQVTTVEALLASASLDVPIATVDTAGLVKPDGTTLLIKADGTLSAVTQEDSIATATTVGVVKPDGTTITIKTDGTISAVQAAVATLTKAGLVIPDGTTITVDSDGKISAAIPSIATASVAGLVKPDGTTLTITDDGTLSAVGGSSGGLDVASNAGAHNSIFRGKYLGTSVTDNQWAAISAGTFDDLFIGDYWTINSVNWRIAAFDYYLHKGDTECTTHHVVIVPDSNLYTAAMNSSNTTTGAYYGSAMHTSNLANAKSTINSAFGSAHILSHKQYLANAVSNGYESAGSWYASTVELMNEINVYGCKIFGNVENGTSMPASYTIDNTQFPLFALAPEFICNRSAWWLRDVVSAANFASVASYGGAIYFSASYACGVRPAFSIIS